MGTNETYQDDFCYEVGIDQPDLLEYWRMSSAYMHTRYGRMQWTADHYTKRYFRRDTGFVGNYEVYESELNLHRTRVYKSVDRIINTYS